MAKTTGAGSSKSTAELFVVATTAVPALPARSLNVRENAIGPAVSPRAIVTTAVYVLPEVLVTGAVRPAIVAVGVPITSPAVKVTVTASPGFASAGAALFDAMVTAVSVGAVSSKVTAELLVVAVTVAPFTPLWPVNSMENATGPSGSPKARLAEAV